MAEVPSGSGNVKRPQLQAGLARESWALEEGQGQGFWIWRSPPALVMGKNQNPWLECNLDELRRLGLLLGRRISGGGTVYHDPGNLNLSWVLPREGYDASELQHWLAEQLSLRGLNASTGDSGAVSVDGYKVSGAAFCYRKEWVLHHCTLLVDADLEALRSSLSVPERSLNTHAVRSVPAPVQGLAQMNPQWKVAEWTEYLLNQAAQRWRLSQAPADEQLRELQHELIQPQWIWGQTPRFDVSVDLEGQPLWMELRKAQFLRLRWQGREWELPPGMLLWDQAQQRLEDYLKLHAGALDPAWQQLGWADLDKITSKG